MDKYISRETAVDAGYLSDWYISSVGDELPVWTDTHIDELLNDFIVIPKDTKPADVQAVRHGRWKLTDNPSFKKCSECDAWWSSVFTDSCFIKYCPNCGARIIKDGDAE